jgi:agmatinase
MTARPTGYPAFLGSELTQPRPHEARFHVLPVPWERTVSYGGGTARGPAAILQASWQLEVWDGRSEPASEGIYTHPPVDVSGGAGEVLERVSDAVADVVALGKIPVVLGGEHTATLGAIQGFLKAGVRDLGVVQIDAHGDLRDRYEDDPFSHACVMRRIAETGLPLFQLGVRAISREEIEARQRFGVRGLDADVLVPGQVARVSLPPDFPPRTFFTIDVDGFDPSVFPATGAPVPGGLSWYQTLGLFESVARQRRIVGFDLMELAPVAQFHCYDFAAALLTYRLMGIVQRGLIAFAG